MLRERSHTQKATPYMTQFTRIHISDCPQQASPIKTESRLVIDRDWLRKGFFWESDENIMELRVAVIVQPCKYTKPTQMFTF